MFIFTEMITSRLYNFFSNFILVDSDNFSQESMYSFIRRFGTHPSRRRKKGKIRKEEKKKRSETS